MALLSTRYLYWLVMKCKYSYCKRNRASLIKMNLCYCSTSGMQPFMISQRVQIPPINDDPHPTGCFIFFLRNISLVNQKQANVQKHKHFERKPKSRGWHWDLRRPQQPQQLCRPPDGCHALWISFSFFSLALNPSSGILLEHATTTRCCTTFISILFMSLSDRRSSYRDHEWIWVAHSGAIICANIL